LAEFKRFKQNFLVFWVTRHWLSALKSLRIADCY
jgi:hypothetical protein